MIPEYPRTFQRIPEDHGYIIRFKIYSRRTQDLPKDPRYYLRAQKIPEYSRRSETYKTLNRLQKIPEPSKISNILFKVANESQKISEDHRYIIRL